MMLKALRLTLPVATGFLLVALATAQDFQTAAPVEESADGTASGAPAESFDAGRVEMSVTELQEMLNLPAGATLKEFQEDPRNPRSLFSSEDQIQRWFRGKKPSFVYFPEGVDPMLIPWEREAVVAQELLQEAGLARSAKDWEKARQLLRRIQDEFPNTDSATKVASELASLEEAVKQEQAAKDRVANRPQLPIPATPTPIPVTLPEWVTKNTSGVLIGENGEPVVVVGSDFLRVGDPVPRYAGVRVKSVAPSEVVFVYQDKEFPVEVVGAF